jgi:hypothetical protein
MKKKIVAKRSIGHVTYVVPTLSRVEYRIESRNKTNLLRLEL